MNLYKMLRIAADGRVPAPLKLLGLWAMHVTGRRIVGVFVDPVMACNLRCRMCYFSNDERRHEMKGVMTDAQIEAAARSLFSRALKLQIGCGAEPTLYGKLRWLVETGRRYGVPYISLTSNGQLIGSGKVKLAELAEAGLSELTLSMHGTDRECYEYLMPGASFDNLIALIGQIADVKKRWPQFRVRVNYTVNSRNVDGLAEDRFWRLWPDGAQPDVVQLRPVQNMGDTAWDDFDLTPLKEKYASTIGAMVDECRRREIVCLAPTLEQLDCVDDSQDGVSSVIEDLTYCYVSPDICYKDDFVAGEDTYSSYHRRRHTARKLLAAVFSGAHGRGRNASKKLNYNVK